MINKCIYSLFILGTSTLYLTSNAQSFKCKSEEINNRLINSDIKIKEQVEWGNKLWSQYVNSNARKSLRTLVNADNDTLYEIPVVVHSFSPGTALSIDTLYNKTDAQIKAWLDTCNAIFAGTYSGMRSVASGGTAVIPLKLVLAKTDINCKPFSGIIRYDGSKYLGYIENGVKNYTEDASTVGIHDTILSNAAWDPQKYYNIFLVNKIEGKDGYPGTTGSFTAGYAYYPTNPDKFYHSFMLQSVVTRSNYSNVLAHEFGHSMGLRHTFEGGCAGLGSDCSSKGDLVCDTEPHINYNCSGINSCTGLAYNGVQTNVMNYSSCGSMNFTEGQVERAIHQMKSYRMGLVSSNMMESSLGFLTDTVKNTSTHTPHPAVANVLMGPYWVSFSGVSQYSDYNWNTVSDGSYENYVNKTCYAALEYGKMYYKDTDTLKVGINLYNAQRIKAWIDYNNDGEFQTSEMIMNESYAAIGSSVQVVKTKAFTAPETVVKDKPLRVRIITDLASYNIDSANYNPVYGQVEDYAIIFTSGALHIPMFTFEADASQCAVTSKWKLNKNHNIASLELQRSVNGKDFSTISNIPTSILDNYYIDYDLSNGLYQYRLLAITTDNKISYSAIKNVSIQCNQVNNIIIYPNPTNQDINISINEGEVKNASIVLYDIHGKVVYHTRNNLTNNEKIIINLTNLIKGNYYLKIYNEKLDFKTTIIKY